LPHGLSLRATAFAGLIQQAGAEEMLGLARTDEVVPKAMRRRLSLYDMAAARCVAGLAAPFVNGKGADEDIVFASRYGNMAVTFDLLTQVVADELLSPAKFSVSVHNAAAGAASMVAKNRAGHTAVSALDRTAAAGLTETWTRIADGASSIICIYSDIALMTPYAEFDEAGASVTLAVRFSAGSPDDAHELADGRLGAETFARALAAGAGGVTWRP
jgi:hypothetical protein